MTDAIKHARRAAPGNEGVALLVVLVFLFLATILGVAGMRSAKVEERMAGNITSQQVAFQTAEGGIAAGRQVVTDNDCDPPESALHDDTDKPLTNPENWKDDATHTDAIADHAEQDARYIIEKIDPGSERTPAHGDSDPDTYADSFLVFRITAQGFGRTDGSTALVQESYRCRK